MQIFKPIVLQQKLETPKLTLFDKNKYKCNHSLMKKINKCTALIAKQTNFCGTIIKNYHNL